MGHASTPGTDRGGADIELDVVNASTGGALFSKTSVSLVSGNVYTLFMSGGGTAAVNGALKKDR